MSVAPLFDDGVHHVDLVDIFALQERNFRYPVARYMPTQGRHLDAAPRARVHRPLPPHVLSPYWEPEDQMPDVVPSAIWTTNPIWYALRLRAFIHFVRWVHGHLAALDPLLEAACRAQRAPAPPRPRRRPQSTLPPPTPIVTVWGPEPTPSSYPGRDIAIAAWTRTPGGLDQDWDCLYCEKASPASAWLRAGLCPHCHR